MTDNPGYQDPDKWWQRWDIEDFVFGPMEWSLDQDGLIGLGMIIPCIIWFAIGIVLWVSLTFVLGITFPVWLPVALEIRRHLRQKKGPIT